MSMFFTTFDWSTAAAKANELVVNKITASKTGKQKTILLIFLLLSKLIKYVRVIYNHQAGFVNHFAGCGEMAIDILKYFLTFTFSKVILATIIEKPRRCPASQACSFSPFVSTLFAPASTSHLLVRYIPHSLHRQE